MSKQNSNQKFRQARLAKSTYWIFDIAKKERDFLIILSILVLLCDILTSFPNVGMWFGFALASYASIANDSIQTIGTFIASNGHRKWWHIWMFMGSIFLVTVVYSWVLYDGDVSYKRLHSSGFLDPPQNFNFLQLFSPVVVLILTRLRIPVSTTFLLLNVFANDSSTILDMLQKSLCGYVIAFFAAIAFWSLISKVDNYLSKIVSDNFWKILQWFSSGLLWSAWLMQDAANLAVFLPRSLNLSQLTLFMSIIFFGLGFLLYLRGDKMQEVVNEKIGITNVKAATLVDILYMSILIYFKNISNIPMSTTWSFIGLLGGRELAISINNTSEVHAKSSYIYKSFQVIVKDLQYAFIGLVVSIIVATITNPIMKETFKSIWKNFI